MLRESLTDAYFQRRFSGLSFSAEDFRKACDVFRDVIIAEPHSARAKDELIRIEEIIGTEKPAKEKCNQIWHLIRGVAAGAFEDQISPRPLSAGSESQDREKR